MSERSREQLLERLRVVAVEVTTSVGDRLLRVIARLISRASLIPDQPFFDPRDFPWTAELESEWKTIRAELDEVLQHRDDLPNFQDISTDQYELTQDDRWKTYFLYGYGFRSDANCRRCPRTAALVERIPGMKTAMFSILAPGKGIPPHTGPWKGVVRYHLGLVVPEGETGILVGGETGRWAEGASLVFDDTFEHSAWNDTDQTRVVLFVDFVRPLRQPVKALNTFIIWAIAYSPFIQDAKRRHLDWEARFERLRGARN